MNCPKCGGENPDTSKFCGHCGAKLPAVDPAAAIKRTAAFDLGQLPFGGGGPLGSGGGGGTIEASGSGLQTLVQPALPASTPHPAAQAPQAPAPQVLNPAPSAPPTADSPPVSASAGPTEVQPALEEAPRAPAAATPSPLPAVAPAAQPRPAEAAEVLPAFGAEPAQGAPAQVEPAKQPAQVEPAKVEPAQVEPAKQPAQKPDKTRPGKTRPAPAKAAPAKAAPAKVEPAKAEPAQAAPAKAGGPAVALKPESTPAPGQFRETKWFMDALDPEKLNRVEIDDIRDRSAAFTDDGSSIDESFSLRASAHRKLRSTELDLVKAELEAAEERSRGAGLGTYALLALVLGGLGAAAWFLFLK